MQLKIWLYNPTTDVGNTGTIEIDQDGITDQQCLTIANAVATTFGARLDLVKKVVETEVHPNA